MPSPINPSAIVSQNADVRLLKQQVSTLLKEFDAMGRRTVEQGIKAGKALIKLKQAVGHGNFRSVLEEIGVSKSHANRCMVLAKCPRTEQLEIDVRLLDADGNPVDPESEGASPSTPPPAEGGSQGSSQESNGEASGSSSEKAPPGAGDAWEPGRGTPPPPERDELIDQVGNEVPRRLRDVFVGHREAIDTALKAVHEAKRVARALGDWNSWSNFAELEQTLGQVLHDFKNAMPYAVHEDCSGKGCETCRKVGWIPKWKYQELHRV
jgi:hypothetical protein